MGKRKCLVFGVALISVLLVLPVISGCAEKAAPPPAEKVVAYLSLADYTGPIAGLNVPADMGCEDYFKNLNEKGGVDGVKVRFIGVDTRYDAARGLSAYKRYRTEPNLLFMNMIATHINRAVAPIAFEYDKIPGYCPSDGSFVANPSMGFLWGPSYQDVFCGTLDWMVEDWKAKGKAGMPTIGYMGYDNPYGREPLRGGKEYAEKVGINLLPAELFPAGCLDYSIYLTRLADAGADYIFVAGVDPNPSLALRDARKLGLMETIQFCCEIYGPDETVGIKLHPEATEGTVKSAMFIVGDEARAHPWAQLFLKYGHGKSLDDMAGLYVGAMLWAYKYEHALKIALEDVGYEKINGEAMFRAYKQLTGLEQEGIGGPVAYSETERRGSWEIKMYRVVEGKNVPIADWMRCPDAVALYEW